MNECKNKEKKEKVKEKGKFNSFKDGVSGPVVYGANYHKLINAEVPAHSHTYDKFVPRRGYVWSYCNENMPRSDEAERHAPWNRAGEEVTDSKGGNAVHSNTPPFLILDYYIKQPKDDTDRDWNPDYITQVCTRS